MSSTSINGNASNFQNVIHRDQINNYYNTNIVAAALSVRGVAVVAVVVAVVSGVFMQSIAGAKNWLTLPPPPPVPPPPLRGDLRGVPVLPESYIERTGASAALRSNILDGNKALCDQLWGLCFHQVAPPIYKNIWKIVEHLKMDF